MHLQIVVAYALYIWWSGDQPFPPPLASNEVALAGAVGMVAALAVLAQLLSIRGLAALRGNVDSMVSAQRRVLRNLLIIRMLTLMLFGALLIMTGWGSLVMSVPMVNAVPGLASLITLLPYLAGCTVVLYFTFPVDRALRGPASSNNMLTDALAHESWTRREYLVFHIRHHLLAIVVPMTLILLSRDVARWFEPFIQNRTGFDYVSDVALVCAAATVFVIAPWILKHVWTTVPLPTGALRQRLERLCQRIGLRCRDILVWKSGGMVVNAAVMGLFRPFRFVILSDGLIDSMNDEQLEAVFGHEAGHVRHKHFHFFLLFAMGSLLITSGVMEWTYLSWRDSTLTESARQIVIQAIGLVTILMLWFFGFGFISRAFERQADVFGAQCVTPMDPAACRRSCGVHPQPMPSQADGVERICTSAAETLAGALARVATLNGIGRDEPSWRHSSISSRMAFIRSLSGDPAKLRRFRNLIVRIKLTLVVVCVGGLAISVVYLWPYFRQLWNTMASS